jgi:small subunit ribosomal protein S14
VAKVALIERELKRDKLVAKYAKKHAELKAISTDFKRSDEKFRWHSLRATAAFRF